MVVKLADGTTLLGRLSPEKTLRSLRDLSKQNEWTAEWQMDFGIDKYKVTYNGWNHAKYSYTFPGIVFN